MTYNDNLAFLLDMAELQRLASQVFDALENMDPRVVEKMLETRP